MQFARELVQTALAKGEQALTSLQVAVQTGANSTALGIRSSSGGGQAGIGSNGTSLSPISAQSSDLRVQRFTQELKGSHINVHALKRLAFDGTPNQAGLRATVWKVLLGYLPSCPDDWTQVLARRRTQYHVFCSELIVDPTRPMQRRDSTNLHAAPQKDADPLAALPTSPTHSQTAAGTQGPATSPHSSSVSPVAQQQSSAPTAPSHQCGPLEGGPLEAGPLQAGTSEATDVSDPLQLATGVETGLADQFTNTASGPLNHDASISQLPMKQQQVSQGLLQQVSLLELESNISDHPLSLDAGSKWRVFFQDNETLEQITRDVMRTHPDMDFFTGDSEEAELHRQEMRRALFMYAKLNPGLRYIQGMNELIAPLYYLFKHDPEPKEREYAEADAFWCFLELISEFRDHFCQQLDNAQTGIHATIRRLMQVLQHHDYALWHHIEVQCKVDPQYYAFRWITLLLSQEFPFQTTLRIWDNILGDPHGRMDCLLRICTAMILHVKQKLMKGDFTEILTTLQRYPAVDVAQLLSAAAALPACHEILGQPV